MLCSEDVLRSASDWGCGIKSVRMFCPVVKGHLWKRSSDRAVGGGGGGSFFLAFSGVSPFVGWFSRCLLLRLLYRRSKNFPAVGEIVLSFFFHGHHLLAD